MIALGMVLASGYADDDQVPVGPLPRRPRRKKRAKEDQGLPTDEELSAFARFYLEQVRELWPDLVKAGLIAAPSDAVIHEMVDDFKLRHRTGRVDPARLDALIKFGVKLAAMYPRYSDENSQPKSIQDQGRGILRKGKEQGRFVPWEYVFADYARSATYGVRQGYSSLLKVVKSKEHHVGTIYIDEFRRASRDDAEWWRFAGMCKNLGIRLFGASDGFHLDDEIWEEKLKLFNLAIGMETKVKRQTVRRGMRGAAQRFTCRGKLSLGFTKQAVRDESGRVARRADGRPYHEPCIDPVTRLDRERLFTHLLDDGWSLYKMAQSFNQLKVDGWEGWNKAGLKGLLWEPDAIGVFISNRTRKEFDHELGKWVKKRNPRSEWDVVYKPELAIVKVERWAAARKRLAYLMSLDPRTGKKRSRNESSAKTLFSGTLFCGYCGHELTLARSAGPNKCMHCLNGPTGVHGCKLKSSKSTRIIESCVLSYLTTALITESVVDDLFTKANLFIAEESARPRQDIAPLKSELRQLDKNVEMLFDRMEQTTDTALRDAYDERIAKLRKSADALRKRLRDLTFDNRLPPPPLDRAMVTTYVSQMRDVLNTEIPAAAETIRGITGPITIHQEPIPGRNHGATWIATFQPKLINLLRKVAMDHSYPDSLTLEYLSSRIWITHRPQSVPIVAVPNYERLAPKFKEMCDAGCSVQEIAYRHKLAWQVAWEILEFATIGARPTWQLPHHSARYAGWEQFEELAPVVAELCDQHNLGWPEVVTEIAGRTGYEISIATALRAYEHAHRQELRIESGISSEFRPRSGDGKLAEFQRLLSEGITNGSELAQRAGVSRSTANRWKTQLTSRGTSDADQGREGS